MCNVYSRQPRENYETQIRSIRVGGVVRSIRLETIFWRYIEAVAAEEGRSVAAFISELHDEMLAQGTSTNFTSLLRCSVLIYLQNRASSVEIALA